MKRVMMVLNGIIGGANRSAADLMRSLPSDRYEGCIVYPKGSADGLETLRAACPRLDSVYLPYWRNSNEAFLMRVRERISRNIRSGAHLGSGLKLRGLCRRWDVRVIHTNTSLTLTPALVAKALRLPHVWHIRELIGAGTSFRYLASDRLAASVFDALSDRIVANSEQTAAFFREHLGERAVTVIPNGIPEPERDPAVSGAALRASLGIPPAGLVVGVVASLAATWKNHRYALDAVAPLLQKRSDVYLVVYGGVPDTPYARGVRSAVEALGNRARLAGYVADPWAIMGSIDLLAHGTPQESFGRVFVEAMLAGKPVVAPRGGGAISIVADGTTGFLTDPQDPADMTRVITRLAADADLRERLGTAGRARALSQFSLAAHVQAMCRVYDEVLEAKHPRTR
jgi:glycosyltransferase involved in cell wall biosynthesis